jgi:hypothetical protein
MLAMPAALIPFDNAFEMTMDDSSDGTPSRDISRAIARQAAASSSIRPGLIVADWSWSRLRTWEASCSLNPAASPSASMLPSRSI